MRAWRQLSLDRFRDPGSPFCTLPADDRSKQVQGIFALVLENVTNVRSNSSRICLSGRCCATGTPETSMGNGHGERSSYKPREHGCRTAWRAELIVDAAEVLFSEANLETVSFRDLARKGRRQPVRDPLPLRVKGGGPCRDLRPSRRASRRAAGRVACVRFHARRMARSRSRESSTPSSGPRSRPLAVTATTSSIGF